MADYYKPSPWSDVRDYSGANKKKKKKDKPETYEQLKLPLAKRKDKFKHDPRTSANA